MQTLSYIYRPKPWAMLLVIVFFGLAALVIGNDAAHNKGGLIINGLIDLGPDGATIFYWSLAGISVAMVAVGIMGFFMALRVARYVTLTATEISVPKLRGTNAIKLSEIRRMEVLAVQSQRYLIIHHSQGKLNIVESCLPGKSAFEELCAAIGSRAPRPRIVS